MRVDDSACGVRIKRRLPVRGPGDGVGDLEIMYDLLGYRGLLSLIEKVDATWSPVSFNDIK